MTPSQAREIVTIEDRDVARSVTGARPVDRATLTPLVEWAYYLGLLVVVVGTAVIAEHNWRPLGPTGHVGLGLTIGAVALSAGVIVRHADDVRTQRLGNVLWLFATGGVAIATGSLTQRLGHHNGGLSLFSVGLAVLLMNVVLWRNQERPLQFLSAIIGLALTVSGFGIVGHLRATPSEVALLVWCSAVAIGLMSLQMLRPALTGLVVAEVGSLVGAVALSFPNHLAGVALGVASTSAAVAVGLALERAVIIVVGAVGFFMFDIRVFTLYVRSEGIVIAAFVTGLAVVLVALWRAARVDALVRRTDTPVATVSVMAECNDSW